MRSVNPTSKKCGLASQIAEEVKVLWEKAWIPHYEDNQSIYYVIMKWIDQWTESSHQPAKKNKPEFQASLDTLLDIRPTDLCSMNALEIFLRKSRNEEWEDDLRFFQGQLQVPQVYTLSSTTDMTLMRKEHRATERAEKSDRFYQKQNVQAYSPHEKTMAESLSVLLNKLCDVQLSHEPPSLLRCPRAARNKRRKRLRNHIFDIIFGQLHGPHRLYGDAVSKEQRYRGQESDELYACAFQLRQQNRYDDANHLEFLTEKLTRGGPSEPMEHMLQFLLLLTGSGSNQTSGHHRHHMKIRLPIVHPNKEAPCVLPKGPRHYGETRVQVPAERSFMQYPRELFESVLLQPEEGGCLSDRSFTMIDSQMFEAIPGTTSRGHNFFKPACSAGEGYSKKLQTSLFGALVHSRTDSLDVRLGIPALAESSDPSLFSIKVPQVFKLPEDEGFADKTPSTGSESVANITLDSSGIEEDIWSKALQVKPDPHLIWESVGRRVHPREKPFITEAGPEAFDELYQVHQHRLRLFDPSYVVTTPQPISVKQLIKDILNLLMAIPSNTFSYNIETQGFGVLHGRCVMGLSPEGLVNLCEPLIQCANHYHRLMEFSQPPIIDSTYSKGLIYQAFLTGIRQYLQHYRACILSISSSLTLLQLTFLTRKLTSQMHFLARLCEKRTDEETYPTGVPLMSYLYQEALDASGTDTYCMLISLLHTAAQPYLRFVQDWVFEGVCRDVYGEFMLQVNTDYLRFRDKHYWTHGYVLAAKDAHQSVPLFLGELAHSIYVCGKSINLLRLVAPQHFLFSIEHDVPYVSITFSEDQLKSFEDRSKAYVAHMRDEQRRWTTTREELIKKEETARISVLVKARHKASERIAAYTAKVEADRRAGEEKKRETLRDLKTQMETDLRRRATEKENEAQEDKDRLAEELSRLSDLEQQARLELEEKYKKLEAEAEERERRARWRARRLQLDKNRREFLEEEKASLDAALAENPLASSGDTADGATGEIPDWAQREGDTVMVDEPGVTLPKWAEEGLKTAPPGFEVDSPSRPVLPDWAQKRLQDASEATVMVDDASEKGISGDAVNPVAKQQHPSDSSIAASLVDPPMLKMRMQHQPTEVPFKRVVSHAHPSDSTVSDLLSDGVSPSEAKSDADKTDSIDGIKSTSETGEESAVKPVSEAPSLSVEPTPGIGKVGDGLNKEVTSCGSQLKDEQVDEVASSGIQANEVGDAAKEMVRVNDESESLPVQSQIKLSDAMHASKESESGSDFMPKALTDGKHMMDETKESVNKCHIKLSGTMSATQQSESEHVEKGRKLVEGMHANLESREEQQQVPRLKKAGQHMTDQSAPAVNVIKKASFLGHVSQLSNSDYAFAAPRLKRSAHITAMHASKESESGSDFMPKALTDGKHMMDETKESVNKCHIKLSGTMSATQQSESEHVEKGRKLVEGMHANLESREEQQQVPRLKKAGQHMTDQSAPAVNVIKKASFLGHVSQLSNSDYAFAAPRLKRPAHITAMHVSKESESGPDFMPKALTDGKHMMDETKESVNKCHIKLSGTMSATQQSESEHVEKGRKLVEGMHANLESREEQQQVPRLKKAGQHMTDQSAPAVNVIKKASFFGHVSQLSNSDYAFAAPRLKRPAHITAMLESSDFFNYLVKPHKKKVKGRCVSEESQSSDADVAVKRTIIAVNQQRHASVESEYVDTDEIRMKAFKERNVYGHSSDSSVQRLLYGGNVGKQAVIPEEGISDEDTTMMPDLFGRLNKKSEELSLLNEDDDIEAHEFISLPALLRRSVTAPLQAQISLVNQCLVDYYFAELEVGRHFTALRRFLLLEDGEFAQSLSDQLFEKLSTKPLPQEMLNPFFLANVLSRALQFHSSDGCDYASSMGFSLKYFPQVLRHNDPDALDCLELVYKVEWPLNIVLTDTSLGKYARVFSFMLQLKRVMWVLKDVWQKLKRDGVIHNASETTQMRQLHLFRHEMQHFVKVIQGYISHQIIHVAWAEFQRELTTNVHTLDQLHQCHAIYLNTCLLWGLLNKKAAPVMKVIQDIFTLIFKFHTQLSSHSWMTDANGNTISHPAFDKMAATYKSFQDYSRFLFKVVLKLALRGYQPHLQELLLGLNFNHYYQTMPAMG